MEWTHGRGRLHRRIALAGALAAMLFGVPRSPVHADQLQAPFSYFAHPRDGDSIRKGDVVRVVAVAMLADPPSDGRLEQSEDVGVNWATLEDFVIRGRAITAVYRPTAAQGAVVKFRTISDTEPWFSSAVEVFVDP